MHNLFISVIPSGYNYTLDIEKNQINLEINKSSRSSIDLEIYNAKVSGSWLDHKLFFCLVNFLKNDFKVLT